MEDQLHKKDLKPSFRVRLADFSEEELIVYHKWFLESDPPRITCRPIENESIENVLERYGGRFAGQKIRHFAVRRIEDDEFIGRVTYFDLNTRNRSAEIGFLIGPQFRRKGYAREAVTLLLGHLFKELGLNKAMAQTGEFNDGSIDLLTGLGFRIDGRLRQHHPLDGTYYDDLLFSILADEFNVSIRK